MRANRCFCRNEHVGQLPAPDPRQALTLQMIDLDSRRRTFQQPRNSNYRFRPRANQAFGPSWPLKQQPGSPKLQATRLNTNSYYNFRVFQYNDSASEVKAADRLCPTRQRAVKAARLNAWLHNKML